MDSSDGVRAVELPASVVSRVEARLPRSDFDSVDEYVEYVLEDLLYHLETEREDDPVDEPDDLEERLRSLGYLNN